jgi:hypothetical protein
LRPYGTAHGPSKAHARWGAGFCAVVLAGTLFSADI